VDQAAETLIKRRDTHILSLLKLLKEPRIIEIMDPVLAGTQGVAAQNPDDRGYCLDLGLVALDENDNLRPANAIYREVMSRTLTDQIQFALGKEIAEIKWTDGRIIYVSKILKEFQTFWRNNAFTFPLRINKHETDVNEAIQKELKSLVPSLDVADSSSFINRVKNVIANQYDEAAYSLLLLSFLQKVVNGGALVHREYAQGRGSVDICVFFKERKYLIECKLLGQKSLELSLKQLKGYLDISGEKEGWLVIFDRDRKKSWEEKITWETTQFEGVTVNIVGC
jgi:hypothetical protein